MVKASGQIEKELGLLQQRTEDMAIALDPIYDGYLSALAEASKRQLMSAVYHLCTQAYPDKFLKLSWKERSELQKALQVLTVQIQPQLKEQREHAKKMSRRPQRDSGLDFLHRLLESKSSGAIIHAPGDSGEDLLEKLSALAHSSPRPDQRSDQDSKRDTDQREGGRSSKLDSANLDKPDSDESDNTQDWEDDIPTAEEYDEGESDANESLFVRSRQGKDRSFRSVDLEDMKFPDSEEGADDDSDDGFADDLDDALAEGDLVENDSDEDDLDFEMEVPAAEQRLTISDEEDLLSALQGLARHSVSVENDSDDKVEQPLAPIHLFKQQMLMEKAIQDVFKTLSDEVNELLQKANVMPSFPKALLAAATDPQGIGEPVNAVPNVVRVSVRVMHGDFKGDLKDRKRDSEETRDRESESGLRKDRRRRSQQKRDRSPSPRSKSNRSLPTRRSMPHDIVEIETLPELAAINLQLSEIAFSDPTVSAWRTRLRKELSTLKRLGHHYTKTQRSLETAQAEDAWRSSWVAVEED